MCSCYARWKTDGKNWVRDQSLWPKHCKVKICHLPCPCRQQLCCYGARQRGRKGMGADNIVNFSSNNNNYYYIDNKEKNKKEKKRWCYGTDVIWETVVVIIIENQECLALRALAVTRESLEVMVNIVKYTNCGKEKSTLRLTLAGQTGLRDSFFTLFLVVSSCHGSLLKLIFVSCDFSYLLKRWWCK